MAQWEWRQDNDIMGMVAGKAMARWEELRDNGNDTMI